MSDSDHDRGTIDLPQLRVTREVPLWGILSMLGVIAGWGVTSYNSQQRQGEELIRQGARQIEIATDVRSISNKMQESSVKTMEMSFQLSNLEQRVRQLETNPQQPQVRK